jgi:hypothetical protein
LPRFACECIGNIGPIVATFITRLFHLDSGGSTSDIFLDGVVIPRFKMKSFVGRCSKERWKLHDFNKDISKILILLHKYENSIYPIIGPFGDDYAA